MRHKIKLYLRLPLVAIFILGQIHLNPVWATDILVLEEQAIAQMEEGHWDEALALFQKALQNDPKNAQIYTNIGFVYLSREEWALAKTTLSTAVELNPQLSEAWYNLASALFGLGQMKEAFVAIKRAVDLKPTDSDLQKALVYIETELAKQPPQALPQQPTAEIEVIHSDPAWIPLGISLAIPGGGQIYKGFRQGEPWEFVRGGIYAGGAAFCYWQVMQNSQNQQQSGALFWTAGLAFITLFSALDGFFTEKPDQQGVRP